MEDKQVAQPIVKRRMARRDHTPRRVIKHRLLRDLLPTLWASLQDGIIVNDQEGRCLFASPSYCRMLGYSEDELIGQSLALIFPAELKKSYQQQVQRAIATEESGPVGEMEVLPKDGQRLFVNVSYSRLEVQEQLYHAFIVQDISDQKAIEQHLLHADRIWTLGTLAGGVAHEFNNLLVSIIGYADMIAGHTAPSIYQVRRFARKIKRAAKRGTQITGQLLPFARRDEELTVPVDLHKLLREVVELFVISSGKRLHVQLDLLASSYWVQANNILLQQVMLNLLLNANDAMEGKGNLHVETENITQPVKIEGDAASTQSFIEIRVIDSGCGMSEEVLQRIFEPFFTTKQTGKGTGLGMALVFSTITGLGGDLHVVSHPNRGTTVYIYLPSIPPPAPATSKQPTA